MSATADGRASWPCCPSPCPRRINLALSTWPGRAESAHTFEWPRHDWRFYNKTGGQYVPLPTLTDSTQANQKHLRVLQICRRKARAEGAIDGRQQLPGHGTPSLLPP